MTSDAVAEDRTEHAPVAPAASQLAKDAEPRWSAYSDRKFFWMVTVAVVLISVLPYLIGLALTPKGSVFYGNRVIASADYSIYYNYLNQGQQGHLFMYDAFTSEAHSSVLIQPLWFALGLIARGAHISSPLIFALARFASIPVLMLSLWWAARWLWSHDQKRQRLGFLLTIFAGGLGGMVTLVMNFFGNFGLWVFPDTWVTEGYTLTTTWSSPHFILVTAGIVFILVAVERSWSERRWSLTAWAGAAALLLCSIHPFHVITWILLWTGLTVWRAIAMKRIPWGYIARWMTVLGMSAPVLGLYAWQLKYDPLTVGRAVQNINLTAAPWAMAVGVGLLLVAAVAGGWIWRPRDVRYQFVVGLCAAYALAIYLPLLFQRRLSQGMSIPFAWLAVPATMFMIDWMTRSLPMTRRIAYATVLVIYSSTWFMVGAVTINDYLRELQRPQRLYYLNQEVQELAKVIRGTDPHQPLLASALEGNVIAGLTSHQVYVGYGVETLAFDRKAKEMANFFGSMTSLEQRELLAREGLCYVLMSPRSSSYGSAWQPTQWTDLRVVWSGPTRTLYQTPYCR